MITEDFDALTPPLISLECFYGEPKKIVSKCLILFSTELQAYMFQHFECTEIGRINACNGSVPIYAFQWNGETMAFYLTSIGSALAAGACYEAHWLTGAEKFLMFGSCGSLDREATRGHFIIPTESYRGEGCSYYFAPASDYIRIKNADRLAEIFDELGAPYVKGRAWTTDSMIRETQGLVQRRRNEGCIAVEMELAGVEAVCDFYGLELYDFLEAGDVLGESDYDVKGLSGANHNIGKLLLALEIIKKI